MVAKLRQLTVADELQLISRRNGGLLDPVKVVEFARNRDTALHDKFEWDDTVAAEQHRLWQARQIIRLELVVVTKDQGPQITRTYVSLLQDRRGDSRGYREIHAVLADDDLRAQLLEEAKREMRLFRKKYDSLKELAVVFAAMDRVV